MPLEYVETDSARFALEIFSSADPDRTWTPREVVKFVSIGAMGPVFVGSPTSVADELERWMDEADIDGFNLAYVTTPGTFEDFIDYVVPELQARGHYWTDYGGSETLRERIYERGQKGSATTTPQPGQASVVVAVTGLFWGSGIPGCES